MINVHRIYLGRSWAAAGSENDLLALFDGLAEFLHSVSRLDDDVAPGSPDGTSLQPAVVKIAMTQAHVVILRAGVDPVTEWTRQEIKTAREGFRWRIPVIAVRPPDGADHEGDAAIAADRVVGWSGIEIALAVSELAEAAAAQHRSDLARMGGPPAPSPVTTASQAGSTPGNRPLPTAEIIAAYEQFRRARSGGCGIV